ncbi:MAG: ribosome maturation factor RimP [Candidatus Omnitrophota bacterium]|nr:ribosome maturation factor RimP [Candidatus Omnitrophota bacterium]
MDVIDRVKGLISGYLEENGMELVDITYRREAGGMTLRLLADIPVGISIAQCEGLNNYLSELLDKENVIGERYLLEVSSPGLDRPITTDKDYERVMGKVLDITTYERIDMRKIHEGSLIGMDSENIVIESKGVSTVIPKAKIAMARLKVDL